MPSLYRERQIALPWLARLRWLAVIGQIAATSSAAFLLDLRLPLYWIILVISVTAISNLIVQIWGRLGAPDWVIPAVIALDVCLLTLLLYLTGGADNPFSILYAVHVAMAILVLSSAWAWSIVALSAACYLALHFLYRALPQVPAPVRNFGRWGALLLVMVLITYFVGRVLRSLRDQEAELIAAREQASRSEHLASLTTLAAGAAHELGTPLSTIALVARELERGETAADVTADAQLIRHEVDRCREILNRMRVDVIEDARQGPNEETLGELLEELRGGLRAGEQDRLEVQTAEPVSCIVPHRRALRRAIGILLRNAFDASPQDQPVQLLFRRDSARMIFQVHDRGAGMSSDVLKRAGEPFFTTKPPGEGMGLGLFLVRLAAETYGGHFGLSSAPGAGTYSTLELPDRQQHESSDASQRQHTSVDPGRGRRSDLPQPPGQSAGVARV